jgi:bidirectional [NiFe] hydrogenase diaphorase subunit
VDYESLGKLGSIMGSGGMIVMDDTTNMVDVARFFMEFCMDESCGKCIPCRAGTVQMHHLLDKILNRKATRATSPSSRSFATWSKTPASAASARPRRIPR